MCRRSIDYLSQDIKITEALVQTIEQHAQRYNIKGAEICAWYADWGEFSADWCDKRGYTIAEVKQLLESGRGDFLSLPCGAGIIQFVV